MLTIKGLSTYFYQENSTTKAVEDVSFSVGDGEIVGLVGESGSGKSTVALSIIRLVNPGKIVSGEILFNGKDLLKLSESEMQKVRGAKISMIFQDPFSSLNPVFTIGEQIAETIRLHQGLNRSDAFQKAIEMLDLVHIKDSKLRIKDYPHQFSGGMQQRVMIAMSLVCNAKFLIADEPTTALDVTIQAEILKLLKELNQKFNLSILFITHNFGIINEICDRVIVMHRGKKVEEGKTFDIFERPKHEYTKGLIACLFKLKT